MANEKRLAFKISRRPFLAVFDRPIGPGSLATFDHGGSFTIPAGAAWWRRKMTEDDGSTVLNLWNCHGKNSNERNWETD